MTCNNPTCNQDRESKMVMIRDATPDRRAVFSDPCIAPLIKALNDTGFHTIASCCGHGHRPPTIILEDGRQIIIARDFDEAEIIQHLFPTDINGDRAP